MAAIVALYWLALKSVTESKGRAGSKVSGASTGRGADVEIALH